MEGNRLITRHHSSFCRADGRDQRLLKITGDSNLWIHTVLQYDTDRILTKTKPQNRWTQLKTLAVKTQLKYFLYDTFPYTGESSSFAPSFNNDNYFA